MEIVYRKIYVNKRNVPLFIIEDVRNFVHELRKIGNNINQLTHLANSGVIRTVYLDGFKEDMKKIWTELNDIWMKRL